MSLSGITFGGLTSGIDTASIIDRLVQLEAIPIQRLQRQQQQIQSRQSVYSQFRSYLSAFAQAAGSLNVADAFNPVSASSSNSGVALLSGTSNATAGTYSLQVSKLAQAHKLGTAAKTDTTTALGLSAGTIIVNGKAVDIDETDSLRSIAQKVNSIQAGVTASLIDGGPGNAFLTLTSAASGSSKRIQLANLEGDVLSQLGMTSGAVGIREAATNGAKSLAFSSTSDTVNTLLGTTKGGGSTFAVNGIDVTVDLSTDNLQNVADKINAAATGASATVLTSTTDGKTTYQLQISGTSSTPTFDDPDNVLQSLGVLQKGYGNELVEGRDAEYKLDGVSLKSATNTITNVIPGATLTLFKANETTPETSTLTVARDNNSIKGKIKGFADAYNNMISFIRDNSKFDNKSFSSGSLFGDTTAQQVESSMSTMLFNNVPGIEGDYKNLTSIGFRFDSDGKLTADDTVMNKAIAENPSAVAALFRSTGVGSTEELNYVSSTSATKASGTGAFAVNITQLATKGNVTAGLAQTSANTVSERLTFSGNLIGSTPYVLNVDVGSTLAQTVSKINTDSRLKDLVFAKVDDDGKLKLESKRYGTSGNFSVASNIAAAADNTGIGFGGGIAINGVDVAGTIHGKAATGVGRFLTANADTGDAAGLQVEYTGTALGDVGSMKFRKGVGVQSNDLVGSFTDNLNGLLSLADKAMQSQIDGIGESITRMQDRLATKQTELKLRFARMEEAMNKVQSQGARLSALATNLNQKS